MKNFGILSFLGGGRDGRSSNAKLSKTRRIRSRRLMLEGLESREMLSVTSGAETVADSAFIAPQATAAVTGTGTDTDPFLVTTWTELSETIGDETYTEASMFIKITVDIDLENETGTEEIVIDGKNVTITADSEKRIGTESSTFTIDHRAFKIISGNLTLKNLNINCFSSEYNGGAIIVGRDGTLTLDTMRFDDNSAYNGGAICNYGTVETLNATLIAFDSNIASNLGGAYFGCGVLNLIGGSGSEFRFNEALTGGAIYSAPHTFDTDTVEPTITISSINFYDNSAITESDTVGDGTGNGGAIANWGTATFTGCTLSNEIIDTYTTNDGGIIFNGTEGNLTVDGCDFSSGRASYGGGISNFGTLTLKGTGSFYNCIAEQNGGAIANNLGATLIFDNCDYDFHNNEADRYGGAIISVGTVEFSPDDINSKTANMIFYDNTLVTGYDGVYKGRDIADGSGEHYFTQWADPLDLIDIHDYKYTKRVTEAQLGTIISLDELADSGTVQIDADDDGIFEATGLLSTVGMSVGAHTVNVRYVSCAGGVIEEAITLNVAGVAPTIEVAVSEFNDGTIVKLDFDVYSDTLTKTWVVGWGDGQTSEYTCYANALCATHLYARGSEAAVYNMTLELIDVNGLGVGTVYSIGTHVVPAVVLPSTAATPEMDSFTAVAAAPVAPAVTESDEILPLFYPIADEEDDLDFVTPQTVPLCAAPETVEEIIFEYDLF